VNSPNNLKEQQSQFLEEMATKYNFTGDTRTLFLRRFRFCNKNARELRTVLLDEIAWDNDILNREQKYQDELKKICQVLKNHGCPIEKPKRGRPPQGKIPWEQASDWLWEEKFPQWQPRQNLDAPSEEEQKEAVCRFLKHIEDKFQYFHLLHRREQPIILKDQYIPIQVTLERKYTHAVETTWGYAESEAELKRAYALKGIEECQTTPVDWKQAKKQHRQIIVLADPGMGKSTLLTMEASLIAQQERESLENNVKSIEDVNFPIVLRLSELAEATNKSTAKVIKAVRRLVGAKYDKTFAEIKLLLKEKLNKGQCILLLDALDEVPNEQQQRNRLADKLKDFLHNYPCRIICTSRIVGYGGGFLEGAKEVEIVPFSQEQTEQYIEAWFRNAAGYLNDDSVSAQSLISKLRNNPPILGLAKNPLLLSLICSLYQEKGLLTLPARRWQVYEQAVHYILGKWSKKRNPELNDVWIDAKTELLEELAYQFSYESKDIFTKRELRQKIDKYLRSQSASIDFRDKNTSCLITELSEQDGILQKLHEEGDQYLFLHRTFQEYLTAKYISCHRKIEKLVSEHFTHKHWQEVFLLVAGLMPDGADELLLLMEKKAQKYINTLQLKALLEWGDEVISGSQGNFKPVAKRAVAFALALGSAYNIAFSIDSVDALSIPLALDNVDDLASVIDNAKVLSISDSIAFVKKLKKFKIFKDKIFIDLIAKLETLKANCLDDYQTLEAYKVMFDRILKTWLEALNLSPKLINLSDEEAKAIGNYFYANWLIVQCKQAAVRGSKETWEGIEERMLRVLGN